MQAERMGLIVNKNNYITCKIIIFSTIHIFYNFVLIMKRNERNSQIQENYQIHFCYKVAASSNYISNEEKIGIKSSNRTRIRKQFLIATFT